MNLRLILATVGTAALLVGCGKSDVQTKLEQTVDSLKKAGQAAQQNGNAAGSGAGSQSADNSGGTHKPVPAIDFHKIQPMLPAISGYTRAEPQGATLQMGEYSYSNASAEYTNGEAHINVSIFDYAYIESLMQVYKMKFSFENADGYTKSQTVNGYTGWETWQAKEKTASCTALIGDRFVVVVEGNGQSDASLVRNTLSGMDLKAIAALQ